MIVIWIPHRQPVRVFEATRDQIGLMAAEAGGTVNHMVSIPPGLLKREFETSWALLTVDMKSASHFDTVQEALRYFNGPDHGLTRSQHTAVISQLMRLQNPDR